MHDDYFQNILYPLQDKVFKIVAQLPVDFYLTGGTALSRAYLHHRYSNDLDFFVNGLPDFKSQVNAIIKALSSEGHRFDSSVADEGFARIFVFEGETSLKIDFVNDVPFRRGEPVVTPIFSKTDNLDNILSNKITALGRYSAKDVADIVYICQSFKFNWESVINDATKKDLWINPLNIVEILEQFPLQKLQEINWISEPPTNEWFNSQINQIIPDILDGNWNSLCI